MQEQYKQLICKKVLSVKKKLLKLLRFKFRSKNEMGGESLLFPAQDKHRSKQSNEYSDRRKSGRGGSAGV